MQFAQYALYLRLLLWSKQIVFVLQKNQLRFFDENHQEVTLSVKEYGQSLLILNVDNNSSSPAECLTKRKGKKKEVDEDSLSEKLAASFTAT